MNKPGHNFAEEKLHKNINDQEPTQQPRRSLTIQKGKTLPHPNPLPNTENFVPLVSKKSRFMCSE
jgi:hypothetical protein